MLQNAVRALLLDRSFYREVEENGSYIGQAIVIVVIVSVLTGLGDALDSEGFVGPLIGTSIAGIVSWVVWAGLTTFIGVGLFGGNTDMGEMLRVLGFAQVPRVIAIIPFFFIANLVAWVWALIAATVAVSEAQDFSMGKAFLTLIFGWIPAIVILAIIGAIF